MLDSIRNDSLKKLESRREILHFSEQAQTFKALRAENICMFYTVRFIYIWFSRAKAEQFAYNCVGRHFHCVGVSLFYNFSNFPDS